MVKKVKFVRLKNIFDSDYIEYYIGWFTVGKPKNLPTDVEKRIKEIASSKIGAGVIYFNKNGQIEVTGNHSPIVAIRKVLIGK